MQAQGQINSSSAKNDLQSLRELQEYVNVETKKVLVEVKSEMHRDMNKIERLIIEQNRNLMKNGMNAIIDLNQKINYYN